MLITSSIILLLTIYQTRNWTLVVCIWEQNQLFVDEVWIGNCLCVFFIQVNLSKNPLKKQFHSTHKIYQTIWKKNKTALPEYSPIAFLKKKCDVIELKHIQWYSHSHSFTSGKPCCFLHLRSSIARLSQSFLSFTFFLLNAYKQKPQNFSQQFFLQSTNFHHLQRLCKCTILSSKVHIVLLVPTMSIASSHAAPSWWNWISCRRMSAKYSLASLGVLVPNPL